MEVSPVFFFQDQIQDRDVYPQNTAVGKRAKNVFPGVLTIYMGDAEILVKKSNGPHHSVWGASENMSCDFRALNFSTLFNLFI